MATGLVPEEVGAAALIVTTVTMILIPALASLGRRIGRHAATTARGQIEAEPLPEKVENRVIIAGYGRVGRQVGEMLARHRIPYLALDSDAARVAEQRRAGAPVYFGDSGNVEILRRSGIDTARALVVTLDTPRSVEEAVMAARSERPDLTIVARARDARHATSLYELGVDDAVPETIEASLQLSEAVLVDVGVPMGLVIASIHERRDEYRTLLKKRENEAKPIFRARRTVGKALRPEPEKAPAPRAEKAAGQSARAPGIAAPSGALLRGPLMRAPQDEGKVGRYLQRSPQAGRGEQSSVSASFWIGRGWKRRSSVVDSVRAAAVRFPPARRSVSGPALSRPARSLREAAAVGNLVRRAEPRHQGHGDGVALEAPAARALVPIEPDGAG
ncbi:hypothetical protein Lal_00044858 [Lupinus albus]|nr:hypothetical protein Lal_00044858 [Lupinus albus]